MSTTLPAVLDALRARETATEAQLAAFLRIPSVSAQPDHDADCAASAAFLAEALGRIGFSVRVDPTAGKPIVFATHPGPGDGAAAAGPRLLFYGHYDVQPAEPLEPWTTPPFEPVIVDGPHGRQIVARGAVDDKGQVMTWLAALAAWHAVAGGPPVPVTVLIEGEEEVGSLSLEPYLEAHRAELAAAAVAIISDTGMWDVGTPALTTRLRGLAYVEVTLEGPSRDLHSGLYGGAALNPLNALTAILGGLHTADGRVAIPGFYDGVADLPDTLRAAWDGLGFDEGEFLGKIGLAHPSGERGRPALERMWARPTADINGMGGGYQGEGAKTVIARVARAKVSFRLVPGQSPAAVVEGFERFVRDRAPAGARVSFAHFGAAPAIEVEAGSPFIAAAAAALADEYARPAVLIGSGGSIPVVESFKRILGLDSVLMGFGLDDDQVHGPNEKFELVCLHRGARAHARLLAGVATWEGQGRRASRT